MKLLLDTHLLLWASTASDRLTQRAQARLEDEDAEVLFSAANIWEVATLPPLHRDPFDRILIAQAAEEGAILLTVDRTIAQYPGRIEYVG